MKGAVKVMVLLMIAAILCGTLREEGITVHAQSGTTVENLTFHNYSLVQAADNGSFYAYDGADTDGPKLAVASQVTVNSQIQGEASVFGIQMTYWSGMVIWGYQLTQDVHVQGTVQITVYMSSSDTISGLLSGGGYGMGISDVDQNGNEIKRFTAQGPESMGSNPFTSTPKAYTLSVQVDYIFAKSHAIIFFAGAGATKQGYKFTIYFDSAAQDSGSTLPILNPTPTSTPSPSPSPSPTTTPSPSPTPTLSSSPTPTPAATTKPTPTPSPSSTQTPLPSPSPTPSPTSSSPQVPPPSPSPTLVPSSSSNPTTNQIPYSISTPTVSQNPTASPLQTSTALPTSPSASSSQSPSPGAKQVSPQTSNPGAFVFARTNEIYYFGLVAIGLVAIGLASVFLIKKRGK